MANPIQIDDGYYGCSIHLKATAAYVRDGKDVTVTITFVVSGSGLYYQTYIDSTMITAQSSGTTSRTFTYSFTEARTLSFWCRTFCQANRGESGSWKSATLTIDIPAATLVHIVEGDTVTECSELYAVTDGEVQTVTEIYAVESGVVRRVT